MKKDIVDLFQELHEAWSFVKFLNVTFLVLVAKFGRVCNVKYFRPISLAWCIYKLIVKILVKRLTKVIDKMIEECQHAFVGGR